MLTEDRDDGDPIAATWIRGDADVDFGSLTRQLFADLARRGVGIITNREVRSLRRASDGTWKARWRDEGTQERGELHARFVFVGVGGWAPKLLQSSGIPEIRGLKTTTSAVVAGTGKRLHWLCACGKVWPAAGDSRANKGCGCKECKKLAK